MFALQAVNFCNRSLYFFSGLFWGVMERQALGFSHPNPELFYVCDAHGPMVYVSLLYMKRILSHQCLNSLISSMHKTSFQRVLPHIIALSDFLIKNLIENVEWRALSDNSIFTQFKSQCYCRYRDQILNTNYFSSSSLGTPDIKSQCYCRYSIGAKY